MSLGAGFQTGERKIIIFIVMILALGTGLNYIKKQIPQAERFLAITEAPQKLLAVPKIDINNADEQTLCSLPGIGPAISRRIIEYRNKNGSFKSPQDIINVKGIGKKKLAKMLPYLKKTE